MPMVWIPPLLRELTGGQEIVSVPGKTVRQVIDAMEETYPGMRARLCEGDWLRPSLSVVVDGAVSRRGLGHPLDEASEVHFVPMVSGGG
jgi:molybdopterin synthase sulfur carrier subunit